MRIRIAYLTADEVNHTLALRMAQQCGVSLVHDPPGCARSDGTPVARLYDLDHVSRQQKEAILTGLLSGPTAVPVAVHSYNLGEDQMASLSANGVIVARSLRPDLVRRLCEAPGSDGEPDPVQEDREDDESSVEPATLCALVRSLASRAHCTLTRKPCAPREELDELCRQLADLQRKIERLRRVHAMRFDELEHWLESLMKRIRDRQFEASA
jgi:hypothetical protein